MKFAVQKKTTINAPLHTVRPLVADLTHWSEWSPWVICEPDCTVTVTGSADTVGQKMAWNGEIIGSGELTLATKDTHTLTYDLLFLTPWKSKAVTKMSFEENGDTTTVTWDMDSSMPWFMFFMIPTMKNWIGMDYERGLKMLKVLAEKGSVPATTTNKGVVDIPGFSYVGIQRTVAIGDVGTKMQNDFNTIIADIIQKHNISAEHWVSLYPQFDIKKMQMTYIAAISDESLSDIDIPHTYVRGTVAQGKALEIAHDGSYEFMGNAWSMGMMYTRAKKMKQKGIPFEQYWNSPLETPEEELRSSVFFPLK